MGFVGDWKKANAYLGKMNLKMQNVIMITLKREAEALRGTIVRGFTTQAPGGKPFRPLSAWTIAMRRFKGFSGDKALIHTGEMRKSIVSKVYPATATAFVGLLYSAKSKDGQSLVNIGKVHEFGSKPYIVRVTPKMRRFLAMVAKTTGLITYSSGRKGKGFYLIKIPARPFLQPSYEKWVKGLKERVNKTVKTAMRS